MYSVNYWTCPNCGERNLDEHKHCQKCKHVSWHGEWEKIDREYSEKIEKKNDKAKDLIQLNKHIEAKEILKSANKDYKEFKNILVEKFDDYLDDEPFKCIRDQTCTRSEHCRTYRLKCEISDKTSKPIKFVGIIIASVLIIVLFGIGLSKSGNSDSGSNKECKICSKSISRGSICDQCSKNMEYYNDAKEAAKNYNSKYN